MSYKDVDKNREYQREQMRRRRAEAKAKASAVPLGGGIVGSLLVSRSNRTKDILFRTDHFGILTQYAKTHQVSLSQAVGVYVQKGLAHDAVMEMVGK